MLAPTFLCSMRKCQGDLFCNNLSKSSDSGITRKILRSRGHTFPTLSSVEDELSCLHPSLKGTTATLQSGPSPSGWLSPSCYFEPLVQGEGKSEGCSCRLWTDEQIRGRHCQLTGGVPGGTWPSHHLVPALVYLPSLAQGCVLGGNYNRIWLSCHWGSAYKTNCSEGGKQGLEESDDANSLRASS